MAVKVKKRKKSRKYRGTSTHGRGARKKGKGKGHRGGKGMSGTGKRADQKKTLILKLYGNKYFGRKGITSKRTKKKKTKIINVEQIEKNYESLRERYEKDGVLVLSEFKILGKGEISIPVKVKAKSISKLAEEKIKKVGGELVK